MKNKFSAKKCKRIVSKEVYHFDSKAEAMHFDYLIIMLRDGKISDLVLQPEYEIASSFELDCGFTKSKKTTLSRMIYTPDFRYKRNGKLIVDEVKGVATEAYRMRLKLFLSDASMKHEVDIFNEIIKGDMKTYYLNQRG